MVAGPVLTGVLIARLGLTTVYLIDVGTSVLSLATVLLLSRRALTGDGTPMGLRPMSE